MTEVLTYLSDLDTSLLLAVNSNHSSYWDAFMWLCSRKFEWIPFYVSIFYVLFRNFELRVVLFSLVAMAVVLLFTDCFSSHVIRPFVARLRPSNLENPVSQFIHIVDNHRGGRYGFPSTHASNTWGLVFFIAWLLRRHFLTFFMAAWALLVCYSRLYLGVHYPSDLLAGMVMGAVGASLAYYVFCRISGQEVLTDLKHPYMPVLVGLLTIVVFLSASFFIELS